MKANVNILVLLNLSVPRNQCCHIVCQQIIHVGYSLQKGPLLANQKTTGGYWQGFCYYVICIWKTLGADLFKNNVDFSNRQEIRYYSKCAKGTPIISDYYQSCQSVSVLFQCRVHYWDGQGVDGTKALWRYYTMAIRCKLKYLFN